MSDEGMNTVFEVLGIISAALLAYYYGRKVSEEEKFTEWHQGYHTAWHKGIKLGYSFGWNDHKAGRNADKSYAPDGWTP